MEGLLKDLAHLNKMLFVVGGEGCVSEMYSDGETEPTFYEQWGMMELKTWHFHLNMDLVKNAQFVEAEDHGAPLLYYVRFANEAGDTLLRCYFPNPYMDDSEEPAPFQPEKLRIFEEMRDRYAGQRDITFVRRPKER